MNLQKLKVSQNEPGKALDFFRGLWNDLDFADVTLATADHRQIKAHKNILSSSSPFFRNILVRNPHSNPLLYLKDVPYQQLELLVRFVYLGEVEVVQEELPAFLDLGRELQVRGLVQDVTINHPKQEFKSPMPPQHFLNPSQTPYQPGHYLQQNGQNPYQDMQKRFQSQITPPLQTPSKIKLRKTAGGWKSRQIPPPFPIQAQTASTPNSFHPQYHHTPIKYSPKIQTQRTNVEQMFEHVHRKTQIPQRDQSHAQQAANAPSPFVNFTKPFRDVESPFRDFQDSFVTNTETEHSLKTQTTKENDMEDSFVDEDEDEDEDYVLSDEDEEEMLSENTGDKEEAVEKEGNKNEKHETVQKEVNKDDKEEQVVEKLLSKYETVAKNVANNGDKSDETPQPITAPLPPVSPQPPAEEQKQECLDAKAVDAKFPCALCEFGGNTAEETQKHFDVFHLYNYNQSTDTSTKIPCDQCDGVYANKMSLTSHKRYMHKYIGKRSEKRAALFKQKEGEDKVYKCDSCDLTFTRMSDLFNHKKTDHVDGLHACNSCDSQFIKITNLDRHKRLEHGDYKGT